MSAISKLPTTATPSPALPSGAVKLYPNGNWTDPTFNTILTAMSPAGLRQSIAHTALQDAVSWVAFNLPVGQVMTLMENFTPLAPGASVGDLSNCGRCIDLVGTGQTESVDLSRVNMNDCMSGFFWRNVDLSQGALELFDDANFGGNRNVIFLSEWPISATISIANWWLNDRVTSLRWDTVPAGKVIVLGENADGSGRHYAAVAGGAAGQSEIADMGSKQFNDAITSFKWEPYQPPAIDFSTIGVTSNQISDAMRQAMGGSLPNMPPPPMGGGFFKWPL